MSSKATTIRKFIGLTIFFACIAAMFFAPEIEGLSPSANNTLYILIATIVLLIAEVFPAGISCLLCIAMLNIFGCVVNFSDSVKGFTSTIVFFLIASCGVSKAFTVLPISKRIFVFFVQKFGKDIKGILIAIMGSVTIISSIISDIAAIMMAIPIIEHLLKLYDNEADRSRTAKTFFILLPICSLLGGTMTPVGSSVNLLVIDLLKEQSGIIIPFWTWTLFIAPVVILLFPLLIFLGIKLFKPVNIDRKKIAQYVSVEKEKIPRKILAKEKFFACVLACMIVLWVSSSFWPQIDITIVTILGLILCFLPGKFRILNFEQFSEAQNLNTILSFGGLISLSTVADITGLSDWLGAIFLPSSAQIAMPVFLLSLAVFSLIAITIIPSPTLCVLVIVPTVIVLGSEAGLSLIPLMCAFAVILGNCYLFPIMPVPLITYSLGHYNMFDMPKLALPMQIAVVVLVVAWFPVLSSLLGL